jgi:hypothetical protein
VQPARWSPDLTAPQRISLALRPSAASSGMSRIAVATLAQGAKNCDPGNENPRKKRPRSLDRADSWSTASEDNSAHNLGMIVWTTGGHCGQIVEARKLSTDGPKPSTGPTPTCPHVDAPPELRRRRLSTQPTAPITVTAFVFPKKILAEKQAAVDMGTAEPNEEICRHVNDPAPDDAGRRHALTWVSTPQPARRWRQRCRAATPTRSLASASHRVIRDNFRSSRAAGARLSKG